MFCLIFFVFAMIMWHVLVVNISILSSVTRKETFCYLLPMFALGVKGLAITTCWPIDILQPPFIRAHAAHIE